MAATRIKICGITRPDDARAASDCGADAIGLVFYPKSSRAVSLQQAADIAAAVPPFVSVVALFVNEPAGQIERILSEVPVDLLQFHGEEAPEFCQQFARPWMKALRVRADLDIVGACHRYGSARAVLLDSWQEGVPGGTGKTFDWQLAQTPLPLPIVLAGGLDAANVGAAIAQLSPSAVDVSGGVESSPGVKDTQKIHQFITAVRTADQRAGGATNDK